MFLNKCGAGALCCAGGVSHQKHTKAQKAKCSKIKLQLLKDGKLKPAYKEERVYIPDPKNQSNRTLRIYARK